MTTVSVDRATSSMLIGSDWAMNTEICEMLNRDFGQTKDVVKGLKRRLKHKNPKVQLLALTLLETIMKNCGDNVYMHVSEKGVLQLMVKIVRKKPDFQVKEKILVLIDTWQEGFGGPRSRYPEYYVAYQELLHAGAVFPQRSDRSTPILALSQESRFNPVLQQVAPESSDASDFPSLSQADIQNARGMMDVLSDMLNVLNPANKEELGDEVIVDLVERCRSYKRRVHHLVNTTVDEELLSLGLALNDDLQRVLAKHDAVAAGITIWQEKPKSPPALVDVGVVASSEPNGSSSETTTVVDPFKQLLLTNSPFADEKDGYTKPQTKMDTVDLLSWDNVPPSAENDLSLVPINEPRTSSTSDQNAFALTVVDGFSNNNTGATSSIDSRSSFPASQLYSSANGFQMPPPSTSLTSNGGLQSSGALHEQTNFMQDSQINQGDHMLNGHAPQGFGLQQQKPLASTANDQNESAFPLPPWETQSTQDQLTVAQPQLMQTTQTAEGYPQMPGSQLPNQQILPPQNSQVTGMYQYPIQVPQAMQGGQMTGMQLQSALHGGQAPGMQLQPAMNGQIVGMQQQQAMLGGQMVGMQIQLAMLGQMGGYTYAQQQGIQYYDQMRPGYQYASPTDISQRMYGISMHVNGGQMNVNPSYQMPMPYSFPLQNHQPMKPKRPEDNLFGDLVSIAKVKQNK